VFGLALSRLLVDERLQPRRGRFFGLGGAGGGTGGGHAGGYAGVGVAVTPVGATTSTASQTLVPPAGAR